MKAAELIPLITNKPLPLAKTDLSLELFLDFNFVENDNFPPNTD